jgi:recombinase
MAEKRKQGLRLGRPPSLPSKVRERIAAERQAGKSLAAIAAALNAEGVQTAQGGRQWWPSTVRIALRTPPS